MKYIAIIIAAIAAVRAYTYAKNFFSRYDILVFSKEDVQEAREEESRQEESRQRDIFQLHPANYDSSVDLRGTPTHLCICGSQVWNVKTIFDNFEIASYFLDMECTVCGSLATAPTPVDRQGMEQ